MGLLLDIPATGAGQSPLLPHIFIPRHDLWARLDVSTDAGVTVVVAPPGAGKTLGVAGWVRSDPGRQDTIWLNAQRSVDLDVLRRLLQRAAEEGRVRLDSTPPQLVVVDDAHLIPPSLLGRIDDALAHHPSGVRLVLLARWDLPLDVLLPALLGSLTILRGDILKLEPAEAASLVRMHAHTRSEFVVEAIASRGQGWCAALVLASRAVAAAPDEMAFAEQYRSAGSPVDNLVASEVFAALTTRQRHLLLCTASEDEVTVELAQRLTGDLRAGEVLVSLESTGLLVTRETVGTPSSSADRSHDVRFHVHPLLREVVRLRLVAGGVDVELANSTVRRSVAADVARGEVAPAFKRLVFLQQFEHAVAAFAGHSIDLALGPCRAELANLARRGANVVDAHPEWWLSIALERRLAGDVSAYRHWLGRIVGSHAGTDHPDWQLSQCIARLALARLGLEPLRPALERARDLEKTSASGRLEAVLALELGTAESWAGELDAAARHLTSAVVTARTHALEVLVPTALSHLALTLLAQGRMHAANLIAQEASVIGTDEPIASREAHERAATVLELAELDADPWAALHGTGDSAASTSVRDLLLEPADRVWQRCLSVQRLVFHGSVHEAARLLECPLEVPPLPRHLELLLLTTRARLAFLVQDQHQLQAAASSFTRLGDACGALWAEAADAEVADRGSRALELYQSAVATTAPDPVGTRQLCRVTAAQLLEREGRPSEAAELVVDALTESESRRDATPFLGWSLRGSDVVTVLNRVRSRAAGAWLRDVQARASAFPGLHVHFAQAHVTQHELQQVADLVVRPVLSQRERDVLNELARGATYGDVAGNLFVSENTVKTHVSSLYSKLGVGRRSAALAVARKLNLL